MEQPLVVEMEDVHFDFLYKNTSKNELRGEVSYNFFDLLIDSL